MSRLQDAATRVRELIFVDDAGRRVASMRTRQSEDREVEVPRADLSAILVEAGRGDAEFLFDEMITQLPGTQWRRCDLRPGGSTPVRPSGRSGWHSLRSPPLGIRAGSRLRRASQHVRCHSDAGACPGTRRRRDHAQRAGNGGRLASGGGIPGRRLLVSIPIWIDHRDLDARRQLLRQTYRNGGWRTEELLSAYLAAEDVYFDSVTRIRMSSWSRGRVTLLGDAASCLPVRGRLQFSHGGRRNACRLPGRITARHSDRPGTI